MTTSLEYLQIENITIDQERCCGGSACAYMSFYTFEMIGDKASLKPDWRRPDGQPQDLKSDIILACQKCPTKAITLIGPDGVPINVESIVL